MRCYHCGQEIENDAQHCIYCGANQGAGATVVLDQSFNPYAADAESGRTDPLNQEIYQSYNGYTQPVATVADPVYVPPVAPAAPVQSGRPVLQLPTNRGLLKMIFLGLITLGIYNVVIFCKMATELNIVASRYDGKRTMPYFAMCSVAPLTLFILPIVWIHKLCNRIGDELNRRGCGYKFSASSFWLWNVLGSFIVVGPFVFQHKLMKSMNLLNGSFNQIG